MINELEMPLAPAAPKRCNLCLHQGAALASREEIQRAATPPPTRSWRPLAHFHLLKMVEDALCQRGLSVTGEAHGLSIDRLRYFGLIEVDRTLGEAGCVIGLRNAHDKRFSAGIVAGSQVFVCDNLSFSGEVAIARKHTRNILAELPERIAKGIDRITGHWDFHRKRIERYRMSPMGDTEAHDLMIRAVDMEVCANSYIPKVLQEWREPRHEEFRPRTLWSFQNAFTEVFKGRADLLPERTHRLHRLLDERAGLV